MLYVTPDNTEPVYNRLVILGPAPTFQLIIAVPAKNALNSLGLLPSTDWNNNRLSSGSKYRTGPPPLGRLP